MILEEGIVAHLMATAAVTAQIGNRLYPEVAPEEAALPVAAYQRISTQRIAAHSTPTGWLKARIQFTVQAADYLPAKAAAAAIAAALDGFRGMMGSVKVHGAFVQNDLDGFNEGTDRETVRLDILFFYKEG